MSMNQLAAATELNKATIYLYFKNKADLIDAIALEGIGYLEKRFLEAVEGPANGLEKVLRIVRASLDFYMSSPVYFYAMNHQENRTAEERAVTPHSKEGDEAASRLLGILVDAIRRGVEDGSIREDIDPGFVNALIYTNTFGATHTMMFKEDVYKDVMGIDASSIEDATCDLIATYLRNDKG
jgi:TetR/AcrR family transcriptional regulator